MPKSKEFLDSSDSASDSESKATTTAKPAKSKTTDSKDAVSSIRLESFCHLHCPSYLY